MKHWKNTPMVFRNPEMGSQSPKFPVVIDTYNNDGTFVGTIDEDKLTTIQRIILFLI